MRMSACSIAFWNSPKPRLSEAVEQRFRGPEIGSAEAFGEAAVDRRQDLMRRLGPGLLMPQPGDARGGPQLPGESLLASRPFDGLPEELLGRGRRVKSARPQDDLAFDAEQLGDIPEASVLRGTVERPVDRREPLSDAAGPAQGVRQFAED